jgi:hypothetical protein
LIRVNLSDISTCKLVNMCLDAFKYTLNKEIYYEIIQQWYIHRYSISNSSSDSGNRTSECVKHNQLNLFLYLLLNLCGCFDMAKLEQDIPFLRRTHKSKSGADKSAEEEEEDVDTIDASKTTEEPPVEKAADLIGNNQNTPFLSAASISNAAAKRAKCVTSNTNLAVKADDQDWEYLLNDELLAKMGESERNLNEFGKIFVKPQPKLIPSDNTESVSDTKTPMSNAVQKPESSSSSVYSNLASPSVVNENVKIPGSHFIPRQKRPINSTAAFSSAGSSSLAAAVAAGAQTIPSGGGILFPNLKSILFTLHLVYEECKLYRSLSDKFCEHLIQILYLLANELNLPLYMNYYELEYPSLLLQMKAQRVFKSRKSNSSAAGSTAFNSQSASLPLKNSLSHFISQEPPVLYKFLLSLTNTKDLSSTIINPFPVISKLKKKTSILSF